MSAREKLLRISLAPGVYVLRPAPRGVRSSRRRAALQLLKSLQRAPRARGVKAGRTYYHLKKIRAARYAR
jgi:hypothetical protein